MMKFGQSGNSHMTGVQNIKPQTQANGKSYKTHDDFDWMQHKQSGLLQLSSRKFGFTAQIIRNSSYMFNIQVMNQHHDS